MKVWFTVQELADAAIDGHFPGLPRTKRGVAMRARADGWAEHQALARPRKGREGGGGIEYHIDVLPAPMRLHYLSQFVTVTRDAAAPDQLPAYARPATPESDTLTGTGRKSRDARLALIAVADRYQAGNGLSQVASDTYFSSLYKTGQVEIAPWVRAIIGDRVSARSLARWRSATKSRGSESLGYDPALCRKDTGVIARAEDGAVRDFVLGLMAKNQFLSAEHVRNAVIAKFGVALKVGDRRVSIPTLRTFQFQIAEWRSEYRNELMKITDPDGYRSKIEFVATGSTRADRLNELWQIDASPLDAIMLSGKRHTIYAAIDVYSRRTIILVTPTPRAAAVGLLIRKCLIAWGVPERIKTDNGSDFVANATQRLLTGLGIEIELSPPYQPRTKGIVERVIGTFQRDFAATLPGFIGHNVSHRSVIEKRKAFSKRLGLDDAHLFDADMTEAEVAEYADRWATESYQHTAHDGLKGRTPFEVASAYTGDVRRLPSVGALNILLAPVAGKDGLRRVTKTGILVEGENYRIGSIMPGRQVFCRMDPADLGRLWVFEPDGETFIGEAICPALAGVDPVAIDMRVKAEQKAFMEGRIKPIRAAMRKIGPRQALEAQLAAGKLRGGTLLEFPKRSIEHTTPLLNAAADALRGPEEGVPLSDAAAAAHQALQASFHAQSPQEPAAPNVRRLRVTETREQRFKRALDIEAALETGLEVGASDLLWLGSYRESPEYKAMRKMKADFGDAMQL